MSLIDDAKALWHHIVTTVTPQEAVAVITGVVTGIHDTAAGRSTSVLASIKARDPKTLALIEDAIKGAAIFAAGPLAGAGVSIAFDLLGLDGGMSQDEQNAWMDRQNERQD